MKFLKSIDEKKTTATTTKHLKNTVKHILQKFSFRLYLNNPHTDLLQREEELKGTEEKQSATE